MTKYQTQFKPRRFYNTLPFMPAVIGATLLLVAPAVSNAAGDGEHMVAPAAEITLVAETETKRPAVYQDQLDDTYAKLNKNASDIRGFIEDLKDLSAMTPEMAKEAAEEVIGIATDIESLFVEGGDIDTTIDAARDYFRVTGTNIGNLQITAAQKETLLNQLQDHKRDFDVQISNLDELRNQLQVLTAQAEQSREYFVGLIMVQTAEGIVEHVQAMTQTMSAMAENLTKAINQSSVAGV